MSAPDALETLAVEAANLEATEPAAALPPGAPAAPPPDPAAEWRDAARMAAGLIVAMYPELAPHWTSEKLDNFGNALAKCAEHYGWSLGAILGHPLVGLALATWPLAVPLMAVAKSRAAQAQAQQRAAQATEAKPSAAVMNPSTAVPDVAAVKANG